MILFTQDPGNFISAFLVVWLSCAGICKGISTSTTCDKWAALAATMTGNGEYHTCVSNNTAVCTRYDCEGSLAEKGFPIDYCFGLQLNSCNQPLSMDFYLKLPVANFSTQVRITHDQIVYLSDLHIPILKTLQVKPLLNFEFEKDKQDSVLVSVTFRVKSAIFPIYFDKYEQKIVDEEEVPVQHCDGPLTKDNSTQPAPDFMKVPCHAQKYPPPVVTPAASLIPAKSVKPSATYNQVCDFVKTCSQGEVCQLAAGKSSGKCQCEPDYHYLKDKKVCVSKGKFGAACRSRSECGTYEECKREADGSGHLKCVCEGSYSWNEGRRLCVLDRSKTVNPPEEKHGPTPHPSSAPDVKVHTTSKPEQVTKKPAKPAPHSSKDAGSGSQKYIIAGASAAGVVVLVVVVVGTLIFCRRRRRNSSTRGGGLYDSADTPMLTDTDDVDLVM